MGQNRTIRIKAERRQELGKEKVKKLRKMGYIPAVVYGQGKVYEYVKVKQKDINILIREKTPFFELELDNGKIYRVSLKDVQIHPVTDQPIHFDFYVTEIVR